MEAETRLVVAGWSQVKPGVQCLAMTDPEGWGIYGSTGAPSFAFFEKGGIVKFHLAYMAIPCASMPAMLLYP
jgi:hypothetical protein